MRVDTRDEEQTEQIEPVILSNKKYKEVIRDNRTCKDYGNLIVCPTERDTNPLAPLIASIVVAVLGIIIGIVCWWKRQQIKEWFARRAAARAVKADTPPPPLAI